MGDDNLPMLPWWPRDFLASTLGWRLLECGLFRALLDAQWDSGALPNDPIELAWIARATSEEFESAWPRVRTKFVLDEQGRLVNLRLEEHRRVATELRARKSKAGRAGGLVSAAKRTGERQSSQAAVQADANDRSTTVQAEGQAENESACLVAQADVKHPSPSPSPSPSSSQSPSPSPSPPPEISVDNSPDPDTSSGTRNSSRADPQGQKSSREQRGSRCPEPFLVTAEMHEWAREQTPSVDVDEATAEFVDFWRAVPGARGRKVDWISTWRNRMREREARLKLNGSNRHEAKLTKYDRIKRALDDG